MTTKYYFRDKDSELCYSLEYHLSNAAEEGLKEVNLFEAIPETIDDMFWCKHFDAATSEGEGTCGKSCEGYTPKNGKWGICKHKSGFFTHGNKVSFKVDKYKHLLLKAPPNMTFEDLIKLSFKK